MDDLHDSTSMSLNLFGEVSAGFEDDAISQDGYDDDGDDVIDLTDDYQHVVINSNTTLDDILDPIRRG